MILVLRGEFARKRFLRAAVRRGEFGFCFADKGKCQHKDDGTGGQVDETTFYVAQHIGSEESNQQKWKDPQQFAQKRGWKPASQRNSGVADGYG
jgi:hypothetical protein